MLTCSCSGAIVGCMKIGYGRSRDAAEARALPEALRKAGAERFYVDTPDSYPAERDAMFRDLRPGDNVLLLSRSHIGIGKEIGRLTGYLERQGVDVRVDLAPHQPKRKPGPPPRFAPDRAQEEVCRHYWHGPFRRRDAVAKCSSVMGYDVTVNSLNRYLGPRSKPTPWINEEAQK